MDNYKKFETNIGGKPVLVEIGALCCLASGSCTVTCGETIVMANATMADKPREGLDYFPLSVDFEEKLYAVGKIPGGFKKREGRAGDSAILTSRLIDRPLRPLFPKGMFNEVSMVVTTLSIDPDVDPQPFGMLASSIALSISDIPFAGPTGSVVVGRVDGNFIINPNAAQSDASDMHVTVSGTGEAILMVEAGANQVSEADMLAAILFGHEEIKKMVDFQNGIVKKIGKTKRVFEPAKVDESLETRVKSYVTSFLEKALSETNLEKRREAEKKVDEMVADQFAEIIIFLRNQIISAATDQRFGK